MRTYTKKRLQPTNRTSISQCTSTMISSTSPACADAATGIRSQSSIEGSLLNQERRGLRAARQHHEEPREAPKYAERDAEEHEDPEVHALAHRRAYFSEAHRTRHIRVLFLGRRCGRPRSTTQMPSAQRRETPSGPASRTPSDARP